MLPHALEIQATVKAMQLSIIVPVYNVEKYVRPCLESILRQGLDEDCYEVIIVNDGTKDRSMEMIADLIDEHANISVINQENQSLSVARNNGIAKAKGEYILMPDSDDLLIDGSLPTLLEKALETKADLVVADFLEMDDEEIANVKDIPQPDAVFEEKTGEQLFLADLDPRQCYVWRTLFRREYLSEHRITFVPGVCYQDVPFTHECYIKAKKCLRTHWLLNIYRKNRGGSATFFCIIIAKTWELTRLENLSPQVQRKLQDDVFVSLSSLSYSAMYHSKDPAFRLEVIKDLRQKAPDLKFTNGIRAKTMSFLLRKAPRFYFTFFEWQNKIRKQLAKQ